MNNTAQANRIEHILTAGRVYACRRELRALARDARLPVATHAIVATALDRVQFAMDYATIYELTETIADAEATINAIRRK